MQVTPCLCFKARLSAKQLIWNMIICSHVSKTYFYKKGFALSLALQLRVTVELGNGLLYALLIT